MSCPHQALFLAKLHKSKLHVWKTLPSAIAKTKTTTSTNKLYTLRIINHWRAKQKSRRIPDDCIEVVAAAYADAEDEGTISVLAEELRREVKKDSHEGDFWVSADAFLASLRIIKPVFPPFTSPRRQSRNVRSHGEQPFLDFLVNRLRGFSGHLIDVKEETDVTKTLEDLVNSRSAGRIGFGLLSSYERITLLDPLFMPMRDGLNGVYLIRDEEDPKHIETLRQLLLGTPAVSNERFLAFAAKHEVGWTHVNKLIEEKVLGKNNLVQFQDLTPQKYVEKMLRRSALGQREVRFAVADEVTCLSILRELKSQQVCGRLIFKLATAKSINAQKPEYLMSILIKRGQRDIFDYVKDAMWMLLQGDVELIALEYVKLCRALIQFATLAGEQEDAAEWAEYTLRLSPDYLKKYVDHNLPWRPILERAYSLYKTT